MMDDEVDMSAATSDPAVELAAMSAAANALHPLSPESRRRAIMWLAELFGTPRPRNASGPASDAARLSTAATSAATEFDVFADLFDAASPRNDGERVLVALYWLQVIESRPSAASLDMTKLLTDLGHRIGRIRNVLPSLQSTKPALVIQVSHGSGQAGRRVVKLTTAGIKRVQGALASGGFEPLD